MGERLTIAGRELRGLRREKTIVLALAVQVFVAAFSSFLVVGLVGLYSPGAAAGAAVEVGVAGNASDDLGPVVARGESRRAVGYGDAAAAREAFRAGDVDAVLVAHRQPSGRVAVQALAPAGEFRTTLVVVQLKDALAAYERQRRAELSSRLDRQPLPLPPEAEGSPYVGFTYGVLVPLLVFLPVFVSGSLAVDAVTEELERGTLELLRVAPVTAGGVVDGKALAALCLVPAQVAAWLALLAVNGTRVANPVPVVALATALGAAVVAGAAAVGVATRDRQSAQFLYSFGVLALFALASLLPEGPANAVAKLAIGSPTALTWVFVAVSLAAGAAGYLAARAAAVRALRA